MGLGDSVGDAKGEGRGVEVAVVLQLGVAFVVADKVVVEDGIEIEVELAAEQIAECKAAKQTGIEAAVFGGEGTLFVEGVEEDVIVGHDIGGAFDAVAEPVAGIAAKEQMAPQTGTPEGEVGHEGQEEVGVAVVGKDGCEVIEVALEPMVALHGGKVGTDGEPGSDGIATVDSEVESTAAGVGLVDAAGLRAGDGGAADTTT